MNRGRHRKKKEDYPPEINQLKNKEAFKKAFTPEQARLLLIRQVEAGNRPDLTVFERDYSACKWGNGFDWDKTPEGWDYWNTITWNYHLIKGL